MKKLFLEGLPGAGKSTTLEIMAANGTAVTRELGLVLGLDAFPGNGTTIDEILAIDDWFITQETKRMKQASGIFDRSYLTHLTYAYGYGRYTSLESLGPTVKKYDQAITIGELALPDAIAYIDVEPELSIERQLKRASSGIPLLDDFWMDKFFLQDLRDAYHELFSSCTDIPVLLQNGDDQNTVIAENVTTFYESLKVECGPVELDLGRYVLNLELGHDH